MRNVRLLEANKFIDNDLSSKTFPVLQRSDCTPFGSRGGEVAMLYSSVLFIPGPPPSPQQPRVTLAVDGDRWMAFHCSPRLARVLQAIRAEINNMVSSSISPAASANNTLFHHHTQLIQVISLLLTLPIQETLPSN